MQSLERASTVTFVLCCGASAPDPKLMYSEGDAVSTPKGPGRVLKVSGVTVRVEFADGKSTWVQFRDCQLMAKAGDTAALTSPAPAADKSAADKAAAEKAAADKAAADKVAAEKVAAEKAVADKAAAEKAAADKAAAEKAAAQKAAAEKAATEKAAAEKAATDKAVAEKAVAEKASREAAASEDQFASLAAAIDAEEQQALQALDAEFEGKCTSLRKAFDEKRKAKADADRLQAEAKAVADAKAAPAPAPAPTPSSASVDPLAAYSATVVLLYTPMTRDQLATVATRKIATQLQGLRVPFSEVDGTQVEHKDVRAALWKAAGAKPGTYPILYSGLTGFVTQGDALQDLLDSGELSMKLIGHAGSAPPVPPTPTPAAPAATEPPRVEMMISAPTAKRLLEVSTRLTSLCGVAIAPVLAGAEVVADMLTFVDAAVTSSEIAADALVLGHLTARLERATAHLGAPPPRSAAPPAGRSAALESLVLRLEGAVGA